MRRVCEDGNGASHPATNKLSSDEEDRNDTDCDQLVLCGFVARLLHDQTLIKVDRRLDWHGCAKDIKLMPTVFRGHR